MLLRRLISTKNIELYELKNSNYLYGPVKYYMLLIDYRRESRFEDFPHLRGMDKNDFLPRENYIQAIIIYNDYISDSDKELTYESVPPTYQEPCII
ncbi:hypothetical protein [Herbinix luporum]|uniref:Uncharacterized protein n=1 Tax=Herbinix luporum TaxID=1679721 RepID=A0A0K8J665_9FIRM|nr:hypothetical protein [Herbinix luporum]CUH92960.1 hypothetical protein SD1D_1414 [Herbinix luporum]